MWEYAHTDELYHYGVLGMKWGVRRYQAKDGSLTEAGKHRRRTQKSEQKLAKKDNRKRLAEKERRSKDVPEAIKAKQDRRADVRKRRVLTDADLKKKIERLKLEKELKKLTEEDISPGRKFVKEVVSDAGKKVATAAVTGAMAYAIKAAVEKNVDKKDLASYLAPNPHKK